MTSDPRRAAALVLCDILIWLQIGDARRWGRGLRHEVAAIADAGEALRFALGAFLGMLPACLAARLFRPPAVAAASPATLRQPRMPWSRTPLASARGVGVAGGVAAVFLGVAYLALAGAPATHIRVNLCALLTGLVLALTITRLQAPANRLPGVAMLLFGLSLCATTMAGTSAGEVTRWTDIGGLVVQPSLMLLPAMIVTYPRAVTPASTIAALAAVTALAVQPDSTLLAVAALALLASAALGRRLAVAGVAGATAGALAFAATRPHEVAAAPFVDGVLSSSFDLHPLVGVAVWAGCVLLVLPAIVGWWRDRPNRSAYLAFGVVWAGMILAAGCGDGPTPVVGYGGSAIVGYFLSVAALPHGAANASRPASHHQSPRCRPFARQSRSAAPPLQPPIGNVR